METHIGTLTSVTQKEGKKSGKPYWVAKIGDEFFNTPVSGIAHWLESQKDKTIAVDFEYNNEGYKDVNRFYAPTQEQLSEAPPEATESKSNGNVPQEVWELKDRRIARQAIAKSCIEAGTCGIEDADRWFAWVWELPAQSTPKATGENRSKEIKGKPQTEEDTLIKKIYMESSRLKWTAEELDEALTNWATNTECVNLDEIKEQGLRACNKEQLEAFLKFLQND